jgi:hypothetical protein
MTEPITTVEAAVAELGALPVPCGPQLQTKPDAVEFGIRLSDGSVFRGPYPQDRQGQEVRLARLQEACPRARLVQRTVHYGDWTEADQ